jgi:stage III sporulation protein AD
MGWLFQTVAGVLIALVMWIILSGRSKEYAQVLSIGACCLVLGLGLRFTEPIFELLDHLQAMGNLKSDWLSAMLKAVGIGLVVEIGVLICTDAGNAALGKSLQTVGTIAVLWVSVPLLNALIALLEDILGGI